MGEPGQASGSGGSSSSDESPKVRGIDTSHMTEDELREFIDTGRTGRRNALHDVTQPGVSTAGVAETMERLSVKESDSNSKSEASAKAGESS